jgi:hypothetical protein
MELYFAPNVEMFKRFMLSKPNDMPTAIWTDKQKKPWIDTKVTLGQYFQTQIFIASLNDLIYKEIMKCTYANIQAIYKIIQQDNKAVKPVIVALWRMNPLIMTLTPTSWTLSMLSTPAKDWPCFNLTWHSMGTMHQPSVTMVMEILLPTGPATTEPTNGLADNVGTTINLDNCRKTATKEKLPELPWLMGRKP